MAKVKISEFNSNPALNTDIDSINLAEGCAPSGINDAIRELMSQLKDWQSGTSNDPMVIGSTGSLTLNQGTANGVAYLNGSKVVTSGSALTFDGTNLGLGTASPSGASGTTFAINGGAGQTRIALKNTASGDTSTDGFQIALLSDGVNVVYQNRESGYQAWEGNGSELMRLTSTGLGIGTSSPSAKLNVVGSSDMSGIFESTGTSNAASLIVRSGNGTTSGLYAYARFVNNDTNAQDWRIGTYGNNNLSIVNAKAGTTPVVLDSSGNLGLGVTPSAWSGAPALDIGSWAAIAGVSGTSAVAVTSNAYYNSGWKYKLGFGLKPSLYRAEDGSHYWFNAPSGTAGNAISFTQAMSLTADGNLLVGTTSALTSGKVSVGFNGTNNNGIVFNDTVPASGVNYALFQITGTTIGSIARVASTSAVVYNTTSDQRLKSNIQDAAPVLEKLMQVKVRQYDWTEGNLHQDYGFIAQELEPTLSGVVTQGKTESDMWQMDYSRLTPHLVKAIQEQQAIIESLKARLDAANL